MASVHARADQATGEPPVSVVQPLSIDLVELAPARPPALQRLAFQVSAWAATAISPGRGIVQFWKRVWSPGLQGIPTLRCIEIRNGGQHRY